MVLRALIFCLSLIIAPGFPAVAQDIGLRQLVSNNDGRAWDAVGRLEVGGRGFCTGALVAPDLVLTAAHCLFDSKTGALIEAADIEFRAGWRNGRAEAYRGVRLVVVHPEYQFSRSVASERVQNDIALVQLQLPIRNTKIVPFETTERLRKGTNIGVVSYAVGRAEAPSLQEDCRVLGRQKSIYVMSCDVDFGSSGSPVFALENGEVRIASVVAAKAEMNGDKVSLGAVLGRSLLEVQAAFEAESGRVSSSGNLPAGRRNIGAKFVRP